MNNIEADICLRMQIPVRIVKKRHEYQTARMYHITSLHKCKDNHLDKQYINTAGLVPEGWERTSFTEPIENIEPLPDFKAMLTAGYSRHRRDTMKLWVRNMLDEGENKTTLGKKLKELIDDIRKEVKK